MAEKRKPDRRPGGGRLVLAQDPHGAERAGGYRLEESIGREVRGLREQLGMTISELAKSAEKHGGAIFDIGDRVGNRIGAFVFHLNRSSLSLAPYQSAGAK